MGRKQSTEHSQQTEKGKGKVHRERNEDSSQKANSFQYMKSKKAKGGKTGKSGKYLSQKRTSKSRSLRSGLIFPVGRIHRLFKRRMQTVSRVGSTSAIFMAAILEYLTAEVLELAGNCAKEMKTKRISPRQIQLAIRSDDELDRLIKATISGGGITPKIFWKFLKSK